MKIDRIETLQFIKIINYLILLITITIQFKQYVECLIMKVVIISS